MSGEEPHDVPDGFAYSRAHPAEGFEVAKLFGAKTDLVTCLVLERETFLPGKGTDCGLCCRRRQPINQSVMIADGPV